jgi:DNA (cytosine-5)-methyltransferase 1
MTKLTPFQLGSGARGQTKIKTEFRVAEFFAGIGLVRRALEQEGFKVVFANDIEESKQAMYARNFDASVFILDDIRNIKGKCIPEIDLATASFPCTDLSLAGNRAGLNGKESSMFWEFARVIEEMGKVRRPRAILLENVVGFATSREGKDMAAAIQRLNELGYCCDVFTIDARMFLAQSRPRLFIVGCKETCADQETDPSWLRPAWIHEFVKKHRSLSIQLIPLGPPQPTKNALQDHVERLSEDDERWWDAERLGRFMSSLSPIQSERLEVLRTMPGTKWATAYRRTRNGRPMWEIRADGISGCLRTAKGGSGKQALVEARNGAVRVRWMTAKEYASLQGAPNFRLDGTRRNDALSAFGDAVCVPVIAWIAREYLRALLENSVADVVSQKRFALSYSLP